MAAVQKRERLMNLVAVLLAARVPVPFREITGTVVGYDDAAGSEALDRRFDRDKADLRRLGIPIEYVQPDPREPGGYVIRPEAVFQQKVSFTPQEGLLLAIAGRVGAAATGGGALEEALKGALRKLAVDLPGWDPAEDVVPVTVLRARSGNPEALANVSILAQAVTRSRGVRFVYRALDAERAEERRVDPFGLGLSHGLWYLVGWCHTREALRVFKVARIEGAVKPVGAAGSFEVPDGFQVDEHIGREAWELGEGEPCTVRLLAEPAVLTAGMLPSARTVGSRDGRFELELEVRRPQALIGWVLARGGEVEVLEPGWLREAVAGEAARLFARYESPAEGCSAGDQAALARPARESGA